jgi:DNA helicase II / ATP-dependent DNA helicase PcrA
MPDLAKLNEEQRQAVMHGTGPLLIIAGAGTGKTTVVTKRIEHLILDEKIPASNILALTFTEKAAQEMETRVDEILPYGYTTLWIETFHAFCDRILRQEAINIGLNPRFDLLTEAESLLFLRKHLFEFNLDYFRPLGNPMKFLQGMLTHFSRLRDDDINPEQYIKYASVIARTPDLIRGTKQSPMRLPRSARNDDKKSPVPNQDEIKKTFELAHAFKTYEDLKAKEGVMDYSDLISNTLKLFRERPSVLKQYQKQFQYVFVDEFQDTNYAQNEMAILLAGDRQNITVVGDDDQCLPGETLVTTPVGKKQIQNIIKGEQVITAVGKGSLGISTVNKIFVNKKETIFITLTTKSGEKLTATENHKMFCYVPKQVKTKNHFYVYLMHRQNLGWRLGITNDLAVRLKLERSADAIIGLRAFDTAEEARYHEILWSLQYQLPTCIFKERDGVILQGKLIEKLYKVLDTENNARKLANDLGIDLTGYHYVLGAVTRGQSKRIKIVLSQCYRNYIQKRTSHNSLMRNPHIAHEVRLETTNQDIIKKLKVNNIVYQKTKKGIRIRFTSSDMTTVSDFAERLATITGGFIQMQSVIGTLQHVNMPAVIIPAGNLLEGLFVPIIKDNRVYYDEILTIKREKKRELVYDLEIDKTHNFIANNIVVHNSIYRWRGAAIANMLQFRNHFPKAEIVTLTKNYRSTQNILDGAYELIQNNNPDRLEVKENIDKKLNGMREIKGEDISFIYTNRGEDEAEEVAHAIQKEMSDKSRKRNYNDFAILVRANDHSTPFQRALERARIPYQFLGPGHLFQQSEIKDLIAYLHVLANFDDMASLYRIITMSVFALEARDVASILNFAKRSNFSLFEAMEQVGKSSLTQDGKEKIQRITEMIKRHLEKVPKEEAGQILYYFFEDSGLLGYYLDPGSVKTEKEAQNIAKFFEKLQSFGANHTDASVFAVVDWLDLAMELGESPQAAEIDWTRNNAVNILTIHSSKGLEFPVVFVANLVSQRFPSRDRKEQIPVPNDIIREALPEGEEGLQEERRLFYVAITRAQDKLFLTASRFYNEGKRERKISPFVIETLGEQTVESIVKKQTAEPPGQQLSLLEILNSNIEKQTPAPMTSDQRPTTDITYISYSQLQTFDMCPLHYKLRYLMNLPSPPSPALSYGLSVHNTLRDFSLMRMQQQSIIAEVIHDLLKKNWINQGFSSKTHEEQTYKQAETMLLSIAEQTLESKPQTVAVELPFNFWLASPNPPAGGESGLNHLKVGGRIDRIDRLEDGRIEIVDYKTGKNVPTEKKVKEDLQLSVYAVAATEVNDGILGKDPTDILLTLYYLEENIKISTTRTREDLAKAKAEILEKVAAIQKSDFHCSHSIFCKTCEYQMLCQAARS